ncbi:MAG: hypothetical protein Q9166_007087 [cf. Caloplaca sp. 2 TL-2023]
MVKITWLHNIKTKENPNSMSTAAAETPDMASSTSGTWRLYGHQHQSNPLPETPTDNPQPAEGLHTSTSPEYQAQYFVRTERPQDNLRFKLTFSSHASPFTYIGSVRLDLRGEGAVSPHNADESHFQINGTGNITNGEGGRQAFESTFQIVEGSGTGEYAGIGGSGSLNVQTTPHRDEEANDTAGAEGYLLYAARGYGTCVFENVNDVGASLM